MAIHTLGILYTTCIFDKYVANTYTVVSMYNHIRAGTFSVVWLWVYTYVPMELAWNICQHSSIMKQC